MLWQRQLAKKARRYFASRLTPEGIRLIRRKVSVQTKGTGYIIVTCWADSADIHRERSYTGSGKYTHVITFKNGEEESSSEYGVVNTDDDLNGYVGIAPDDRYVYVRDTDGERNVHDDKGNLLQPSEVSSGVQRADSNDE